MATPYHTLDQASLDALESLHAAYSGLELLASASYVEASHVSAVLAVLNQALQARIAFHTAPSPPSRLRVVE